MSDDTVAVELRKAHAGVKEAQAAMTDRHGELLLAVVRARSVGLSLQQIADILGVSRSRAQRLVAMTNPAPFKKAGDG